MNQLDSSAEAFLKMKSREGGASLDSLSAQEARKQFHASYPCNQNQHEQVADAFEIEHQGLRLRVWRGISAPQKDARALLYLHGGGWLFGSPETHEDICRMIANRSNSVVVAPAYRLAPEFPFPHGLNDCVKALKFFAENRENLGICPNKIAVGGDSAGGNLASVLALMARDGDLPSISAQILIYPNTDQRQAFNSYTTFAEGYGLTATEMAWFRDHYLSSKEQWSDWRASPNLVSSLSNVAPAIVALAGHDILFDEGAAYAERLEAESQAVVLNWPGQIHGFVSLSRHIPEAVEAINSICATWNGLQAD